MKRKKILWIVAGVLLTVGVVGGLSQLGSYSLFSSVATNFAVGKIAAIFVFSGGLVAAVAHKTD